jgi:phage tail tube protein FII
MAHYTIHYPDGETEVIQLFGPTKERYQKIEWLEKYGTSPKQRDAERAASSQAAKQQAAEQALQLEMQSKVTDIKATDAKAARDAAEAQKTEVEAMRMMVEPIY